MELIQHELREIAGSFLRRERRDHTLQPTALVNEAYLRLVHQRDADWRSRDHFFSVAARIMRRILVDHARRRRRLKRGGEAVRVAFEEPAAAAWGRGVDVLALNEALAALSRLDERKAAVVELRFFGGFSIPEAARFLGCSKATVERDWAMAKAWLFRELGGGE